ncbi:MAG: efflux RND transporter periplasmic adaptor subunit [Gemmatimonadaceae bacterium]
MIAGSARRALRAGASLIAIVAAAATGEACHRSASSQFFIDTATVARSSLTITVSATGTVEPAEVVLVKSKASGQIVKMPVQMGTEVKPGDLIAQIDPRDPQSRYNQAVAALNAAKANLDVTRAAKARADQLYNERALTAPDHEQAVVGFANAQSAVATAQTNLEVARIDLADVTISAPEAGTIIDKEVAQGQVIASATTSVSGGTTLVSLANLENIVDSALVTEGDVAKVHPGETVAVTADAYPSRTFNGTVDKVSPEAVTIQSVTMFPVIIRLDNSSGLLKPGMNTDVSIMVEQRTNALVVPNDAIGTQQDIAQAIVALGGDLSTLTQTSGQSKGSGRGRGGRSGTGGSASAGRGPTHSDSAGGSVTTPSDTSVLASAHPGLVLVLENGQWTARRVTLGIGNYDDTEVISGLEAGDRVALVSEIRVQASRDSSLSRIQSRSGLPGIGGGGGGARGGGGGRAGGGGGGGRGG